LAHKLRDFSLKKITSSPELKALQTALVLAENLGLKIEVDEDLIEHKRGSKDFVKGRKKFEEKIKELFDKRGELVFGDETADSALERFERALDKQQEVADQDDVLVVTHGTVMSIYVSRRLRVEPFSFWTELGMPMAVVISGNEIEVIRA
jgi:broad specificity phosphatase PhoE